MQFVEHFFSLEKKTVEFLHTLEPKFGYNGFSEFLFYRTYSRVKPDGGQENWADCVIRVVNGIFSIRKDWYLRNHISWDESYWQHNAKGFAESMFKMNWLPPGRGLWAMGTPFVYKHGSMALNNCGAINIREDIGEDIRWLMDALMLGVGVGFNPLRDDDLELQSPTGWYDFIIPDSREGWVDSVKLLIDSYLCGTPRPKFIYDKIRGPGLPIKGFGGISSGPEPLKIYHQQIVEFCESFRQTQSYDSVRLKTDLANAAGCCVVAGNLRRSAELSCGSIDDLTFLNLKDYNLHPERQSIGWISNNSVILEASEDFEKLGEIAKRVIHNGEPGYINRTNFKYGRIGKKMKGLCKDDAELCNPCGEIPLFSQELCCLVETCPTICKTTEEWYDALEYATFYASTVSLLPTHSPETNKIIAKNRRIGVSLIDVMGWKQQYGVNQVTKFLRKGYKIVRAVNKHLAAEAGIPESIRVTTVKPGGTVAKVAARVSGIGHPNFKYTLRRVRVQENSPIVDILVKANVPCEKDKCSANTLVFEFPIEQGPAKSTGQVSLWEQAMNLIWIQREWADNAVSNTLNFKPMWILVEDINNNHIDKLATYVGMGTAFNITDSNESFEMLIPERYKIIKSKNNVKVYEYNPYHEENDIEAVLSMIAPLTKTVSLLPYTPKGVYEQMPEEELSKEEYERRLESIRTIDWSTFNGSDGIDTKFCDSEKCNV